MSLQSKLSHRRSDCRGDTSPLFSSLHRSCGYRYDCGECQSILGNSKYGQFMIYCNLGITFLISRRGYLSSKPCTLIYTTQRAQCNTSTTLYASTSTTLYASYFPTRRTHYPNLGLYDISVSKFLVHIYVNETCCRRKHIQQIINCSHILEAHTQCK